MNNTVKSKRKASEKPLFDAEPKSTVERPKPPLDRVKIAATLRAQRAVMRQKYNSLPWSNEVGYGREKGEYMGFVKALEWVLRDILEEPII